jgi:hypothetical protein
MLSSPVKLNANPKNYGLVVTAKNIKIRYCLLAVRAWIVQLAFLTRFIRHFGIRPLPKSDNGDLTILGRQRDGDGQNKLLQINGSKDSSWYIINPMNLIQF